MQLKDMIGLVIQYKDIIGTAISVLALLVAVGTPIYASVSGKYDQKRIILGQLTDILNSMTSLVIENAKLALEYANNPTYQQVLAPQLNQKYAVLLDQAMYLARLDVVKDLVTAVDYNTLAGANVTVGKLDVAKIYYKKAIEVSKKDNHYKALTMRSYAVFLFTYFGETSKVAKARNLFNASITLLKDNHPMIAHAENCYTYIVWAWFERNVIETKPNIYRKQSIDLFAQAEEEIRQIEPIAPRNMATYMLQMVEKYNASPSMINFQDMTNMQGTQGPQSMQTSHRAVSVKDMDDIISTTIPQSMQTFHRAVSAAYSVPFQPNTQRPKNIIDMPPLGSLDKTQKLA